MSIAPALSHLPTIGAYAFAVYALLDAYPDYSIRELMHASDFSMPTIRRALKVLEKAKLIRIDHVTGKPNHYELLDGAPPLPKEITLILNGTTISDHPDQKLLPPTSEKSEGFYADADKTDGVCPSRVAPLLRSSNTDSDSKTPEGSDSDHVNGRRSRQPKSTREKPARHPSSDLTDAMYEATPADLRGLRVNYAQHNTAALAVYAANWTPEKVRDYVEWLYLFDPYFTGKKDGTRHKVWMGSISEHIPEDWPKVQRWIAAGKPTKHTVVASSNVVTRELVSHPHFPGTLISPRERENILKQDAENQIELDRKIAEMKARNGKH